MRRANNIASNPEMVNNLLSSFGSMLGGQGGDGAPDLSGLASMFRGAGQGPNQDSQNGESQPSGTQTGSEFCVCWRSGMGKHGLGGASARKNHNLEHKRSTIVFSSTVCNGI